MELPYEVPSASVPLHANPVPSMFVPTSQAKPFGQEILKAGKAGSIGSVAIRAETLDNLARVTDLDATDANVNDVIAGVQMVERSLSRELEGAGLTKVGSVDERFDPNEHEAVSTAAAPDEEKVDLVAAVFQVGYRFGGILLRPARVQVYVAPMVDEDAGE